MPATQSEVKVISGDTIHARCQWRDLIDHLVKAHRGPMPLVERSALFADGANGERQTYLNQLAWQPGIAMGTKAITVMPGNARNGSAEPVGQALFTLFDGANGRPLCVLDGTALSHWKTAADSALGAKLLARPDSRRLLMVGAGALAPYMIEAHRTALPSIDTVLVWNRTGSKARLLAEAVGGEYAGNLEEAVKTADIVCCATAATSPILHGEWLREGTHVDLVGAFTPEMRECDDATVLRCRLFVDSRAFGVDQPGDLGNPLHRGVIGRDKIEADLFELCQERIPFVRGLNDITLFKNGGGGHLDLFTALYINDLQLR